jgi:hypothetical protein
LRAGIGTVLPRAGHFTDHAPARADVGRCRQRKQGLVGALLCRVFRKPSDCRIHIGMPRADVDAVNAADADIRAAAAAAAAEPGRGRGKTAAQFEPECIMIIDGNAASQRLAVE